MLKEPKRIIAEEPLSPDSRDTGTGLFSTKDFISQYVADGDLYTLILSIIDTMPMAKVIVVITVLCMIAFYATSFDSIVYTAACYSYK